MFFKKPDLTSGFRPILLADEAVLFVQDNVGLYEGKYKIATCQKGHAYLTSHRACYIDDTEPRANSLSIDLRDVERHEFQAGFLRSSAKITVYPKRLKSQLGLRSRLSELQDGQQNHTFPFSASSPVTRSSSPYRGLPVRQAPVLSTGAWICPICSFSNPVPSNFDTRTATPSFPLPACLACGIKPPFAVVLKAAINANAGQSTRFAEPVQRSNTSNSSLGAPSPESQSLQSISGSTVTCPRCTFHNHPSLLSCELCGTPLPKSTVALAETGQSFFQRSESPGPQLSGPRMNGDVHEDGIKFSFRAGGEKVFYERLKEAMIQRKWLLEIAPPMPQQSTMSSTEQSDFEADTFEGSSPKHRSIPAGIAGLEQRGLQIRRKNETVIGTAFEDLEALMASAKDIVALAEKFAIESSTNITTAAEGALLSDSAAAMGIVATRDKIGEGSNNLYISELSRNLAEYVTDDRRGILQGHGGIMSLIDLWAVFNRSRNGVELVSPSDFSKAAQLWEKLNLPVRLRQFKSGLLVVQQRVWTDERVLEQMQEWLRKLQQTPLSADVSWDWTAYGCGVTAQDTAQHFGWSIGVATEELEMAEENGILCREEGIEGLRFWLNLLLED